MADDKTFTQAEMDSIIEGRLARERQKYADYDDLKEKAPDLDSVKKIHQMTEFSKNKLYDYVPDPYYGGASGFELVLDLLEDACGGLLEFIKENMLTREHVDKV